MVSTGPLSLGRVLALAVVLIGTGLPGLIASVKILGIHGHGYKGAIRVVFVQIAVLLLANALAYSSPFPHDFQFALATAASALSWTVLPLLLLKREYRRSWKASGVHLALYLGLVMAGSFLAGVMIRSGFYLPPTAASGSPTMLSAWVEGWYKVLLAGATAIVALLLLVPVALLTARLCRIPSLPIHRAAAGVAIQMTLATAADLAFILSGSKTPAGLAGLLAWFVAPSVLARTLYGSPTRRRALLFGLVNVLLAIAGAALVGLAFLFLNVAMGLPSFTAIPR